MTERPSKLYTRGGDDGTTGLTGQRRVTKDSRRVHAIGEVDELNCVIGVTRASCDDRPLRDLLEELQALLFELGAELAQPGSARLTRAHTARIEQHIDRLNASLPPLTGFILPGGASAAAHCHLARALCRRAERSLFRLARTELVNHASLPFMNRFSDLLFVVARTLNQRSGTAEVAWKAHPEDST
jgi:cob(I)alamin adenosyltransferase